MDKFKFAAIVVVLLAFACVGLVLFGVIVANPYDEAPEHLLTPEPVHPVPTWTLEPTVTVVMQALRFEDIRRQRDIMAEEQWREYRIGLEGAQVVDWQGRVDRVIEDASGKFVYIDMGLPDDGGIYGVCFNVSDDAASVLEKGQLLTFSGQIEFVYYVLHDVGGGFVVVLEDTSIQLMLRE